MKAEVSVILGYICPKCKHKFKITLQKVLSGLFSCPKCVPKNLSSVLGEKTRELDEVDKVLTSLKASLSNN